MHSAVNVVGLFGVQVFVQDLARRACRNLSSGKSIRVKDSSSCMLAVAPLLRERCVAERCRKAAQTLPVTNDAKRTEGPQARPCPAHVGKRLESTAQVTKSTLPWPPAPKCRTISQRLPQSVIRTSAEVPIIPCRVHSR